MVFVVFTVTEYGNLTVNRFANIKLKYSGDGYNPHKCVITVRAKGAYSDPTLAESKIYFATDGKYGAFSLESFDDVLDRLNIDPDYIYEPLNPIS